MKGKINFNTSSAFLVALLGSAVSCSAQSESLSTSETSLDPAEAADAGSPLSLEDLGELLFSDRNLSANRTQACSTCHDPDAAFVDRRGEDGIIHFASLGDDDASFGNRNAPTAAYALFAPEFGHGGRTRYNTDGDIGEYEGYQGGLFHDGRAMTLEAQAGGPPLSPVEMGMPSEESVVDRIMEDEDYVVAFEHHFGKSVWEDAASAYAAMTKSIAAYERTDAFAPFDSRYDRSLLPPGDDERYVYHPASRAAEGKALFFSAEFTNCAACHQLHPQGSPTARQEVFTGFEYHNLGVPRNEALAALTGADIDLGLGGRLEEESEEGKFKTPTLRNIAVTGPYMHNGVFQNLATVIRFYEHAKLVARGEEDLSINPETEEPWNAPEVDRNISVKELASGNKDLSEEDHVLALECFLMSLTDARYEALLDSDKVELCGL